MRAELKEACKENIISFYHALDAGSADQLAGYFHPEGQWYRKGEILQGPDSVRQALSQRDAARLTCHMVGNCLITEKNDTFEANYYLTVYDNGGKDTQENGGAIRLVGVLIGTDVWVEENGRLLLKSKKSRKHLFAGS